MLGLRIAVILRFKYELKPCSFISYTSTFAELSSLNMYGGVTVPICYFVVELLGIRIETLNAKKTITFEGNDL